MHEDNIYYDILIAKQLSGEAAKEELLELEAWMNAEPANRAYAESIRKLWSAAIPQGATFEVDTEEALAKVHRQMDNQGQGGGRHISFWSYLAAASVVLLLVAVWWLQPRESQPVQLAAGEKNILRDTLADGSVVVLNHGASLSASHFGKKERRVHLRGEAFFDVAPDRNTPFVVMVEALEIRVVGTEFNVDAVSQPGKVRVVVEEGKVVLRAAETEIELTPGEQGEYEQKTGMLRKLASRVQTENTTTWHIREFEFNAIPLSKVVEELSKGYGVNIVLDNAEIAHCLLRAHYSNLPLDEVLNLVAETFSLTIKKEGNVIRLSGPGCNEE